MNAWDVYQVMQLDTIRAWLATLSWTGMISGTIGLLVLALLTDRFVHPSERQDEEWRKGWPWFSALIITSLTMGLLGAILPSSRTAAAMTVLPTLANADTLDTSTPEAMELHSLAKDALRRIRDDDPMDATQGK